MPRFDKTGPMGIGSMTGRRQGICGSNVAQGAGVGIGLGLGGLGLGLACRRSQSFRGPRPMRGTRRGAMQGPGRGYGRAMELEQEEPVDTKEFLEGQKEFLEERLELIKEELENL